MQYIASYMLGHSATREGNDQCLHFLKIFYSLYFALEVGAKEKMTLI